MMLYKLYKEKNSTAQKRHFNDPKKIFLTSWTLKSSSSFKNGIHRKNILKDLRLICYVSIMLS